MLVESVQFGPGQRDRTWLDDAEILRDPDCGLRMVPGDHHHPDPRSVRFFDGHRSFGAGWVDDPYRADEDQVMLQVLRRLGGLPLDERPVGHRERTQRVCGEFGDISKDLLPEFLGQLYDVSSHSNLSAASQKYIGGALVISTKESPCS
jgi:hypothetical protein